MDFRNAFPPEKLGEYTIVEDIAEGTFGKVKRRSTRFCSMEYSIDHFSLSSVAVHTITGHKVAMKFISKAVIQREKTKTRVKREFEYMRTLRHPHIIKLCVSRD